MSDIKPLPLDLIDDPKIAMRTKTDDESLQELMASMSDVGLLEPIIVRRVAERYEVIAGHRRTRAARLLNWTHIESKIVVANEDEVLVLRLTENLQRTDIDPVDEACFIGEIMLKYKKTAEDIAKLLKRSIGWVNERIEIFDMPDYMQDHLKQKKYPLGAALWIYRIEKEATRRYYANWAAVNGMTVAFAHRCYIQLKEAKFELDNARDVVVEAGTPQEASRKVIKCGRCAGDLFLDEAQNVLIHKTCPSPKDDFAKG